MAYIKHKLLNEKVVEQLEERICYKVKVFPVLYSTVTLRRNVVYGFIYLLLVYSDHWSGSRWNNDVVCRNLISYLPIWQHVNLVNGDLDAGGLVSFYFIYLIVLNKAYKLLWKQQ